MIDKIIDGVFLISLVALVALNAPGVSKFITESGNTYANTVKGLQGRR